MPVIDRIQVFDGGKGVIEPTTLYSIPEVVAASDEIQRPIEDPHVVCIDERPAVGEKQPVREKVAGGNLTTGFIAAAAIEWHHFTQQQIEAGPEEMAEATADFLVDQGESLGAHRHSTIHNDNETGCGAVDKSTETIDNISEQGLSEQFVETAKIDLGDLFNLDHWRRVHKGFARLAHDPRWQKWRTSRIQEIVEEKQGVVEVLDGERDAYKDDPQNARHNHWAESARINSVEGTSNDRDNARIPGFQVDVAPMVRMAKKMARNPEEFSLLLHAMVMFQYGTAFTLTKNMRIIR